MEKDGYEFVASICTFKNGYGHGNEERKVFAHSTNPIEEC
jgi:hypothetical protein